MSRVAFRSPRRKPSGGKNHPQTDVTAIKVRVRGDHDKVLSFNGRAAWALTNLIHAGDDGCTPIEHPGPRWAHYVFLLRRAGVDVETIHEAHAGSFSGHHARYVLRTRLQILAINDESEAA